jgi:succinyl-CoA synthetase beta subunit
MFRKLARRVSKLSSVQPVRHLNLQEHVAQAILNEHKITTPKFAVAKCGKEAEQAAKDLLTKNLVVKAQVQTGGRGLGKFSSGFYGGVHSATR